VAVLEPECRAADADAKLAIGCPAVKQRAPAIQVYALCELPGIRLRMQTTRESLPAEQETLNSFLALAVVIDDPFAKPLQRFDHEAIDGEDGQPEGLLAPGIVQSNERLSRFEEPARRMRASNIASAFSQSAVPGVPGSRRSPCQCSAEKPGAILKGRCDFMIRLPPAFRRSVGRVALRSTGLYLPCKRRGEPVSNIRRLLDYI